MNLLLTGAYLYTSFHVERLEEMGFSITFVQDERQKLDIDVSHFDAVVCNSLFLTNDIQKFSSLKFIQLTSVGLDRIPISYMEKNNIEYKNVGDIYSIPMAEWTVGKILEIYKQSRFFYHNQIEKKWEKNRNILELSGRKALIVGAGNVGLNIAKRLNAFETYVDGIDKFCVQSPFLNTCYLIEDLKNILSKYDIVVLTLPLTNETYHLLDYKMLEQMKEDAILINVSRGDVINESDLIDTLNNGKMRGVALDVFHEEPLDYNSILWENDRVIITPHNSFVSDRNSERLSDLIYKNLTNFLASYNERNR